ncbi:hypothetical protein BSKO_00576 [Bryopsis sp. KO-2023]|nr:hypothetical protein BSKO_00576 [Bryopsis sp. KO-2023]
MGEEGGSLMDFLDSLEEFQPTIPDELVQHYARESGCHLRDPKMIRMVGLATQKFMAELLHETLQVSRLRDHLSAARQKDIGFNSKDRRRHLLQEELVKALRECGISVPYVPFYTSTKASGALDE